jgi:fructosamine-3-kinase
MPHWQNLFTVLREHNINISEQDAPRPVGGGDISSAWQVRADNHQVFLKTGTSDSYDMFLAEAKGLQELDRVGALRVPKVLGCVSSACESILVLEWIDLEIAGKDAERKLGRRLAQQHRVCEERFGWHRDNTIGSTPQLNRWSDDWVRFLADQRLGYQLDLAARNGYRGELQIDGRTLLDNLGYFFGSYWPEASLLHGDLWGGNWAASNGEPVVFDPAVYYGDREFDIAMTKLFGGFGEDFYDAYEGEWQLAAGHSERILLYQLYHVLNHLNLFGAGYLGRAQNIIRRLL